MSEETTQLPVSPQETQIQSSSLWEKIQAQKKKILIGLGSLLGVLLLAGAAFGIYKYAQRQIPIEPIEEPTPEIATPTPDPTADWETYTNTKYGYSIKYPDDWQLETDCRPSIEGNDFICFLSPSYKLPSEKGLIIIYKPLNLIKTSPDMFCRLGAPFTTKCEEVKVGGFSAWLTESISTDDPLWTKVGILESGESAFRFEALYDKELKNDVLVTFNLILSTFRFD